MRVVILLLISSSSWAKGYIVGGQDVSAQDPIQAATVGIFQPSSDGRTGSLCTGTLIRKDIALTAAHCIPPGIAKPVVIFGTDLHASTAPHRMVEAVAINPKWRTHAGKGMDQGDIALVKFNGGLPEGFKTIPAAPSESDIRPGSTVTLAGYGINNVEAKTGSGRLRKTQVTVLKNRPGKSEMILDQSHGRGACHGDSGGPAFINQGGHTSLAGVTNRGYPNRAPDDCRHQVVYTKVPAYRSWIQSSERKLDEAPALPRLAKNDRHVRSSVLSKKTGLAKTPRRLVRPHRKSTMKSAKRHSPLRKTVARHRGARIG